MEKTAYPFSHTERFNLYNALGFKVLHEHRVDINPAGERIEVNFATTSNEAIVKTAIQEAYLAGRRAGECAIQRKLGTLLGVAPCAQDDWKT